MKGTMRLKDWFRGWRLYIVLMAAALLIALIVINRQVILQFQTPLSLLFITVAFFFGLYIGKVHAEEKLTSPETATAPATKDMPSEPVGDTRKRIDEAIARFPLQYPNYQTIAPKLDADVRPWLKESGLAKNDRESHVIGTILSEEYRLSPDR